MSSTAAPRTRSLEHEAFLALQRVAARHRSEASDLLREAGLSGPQYNVLRILRGAGAGGLTCGEVGDRLIVRDPDITRLLDRLEKQGYIERERDQNDRRVVTTRITRDGLAILARLDEPMLELHRKQLGHLGRAKLRQLLELIGEASQ